MFEVDVKEVREKVLPELDDDFASEASEFDTLEELRDEIRRRLDGGRRLAVEQEFREAAIDVVAANAKVDLPDRARPDRAAERWGRVERQLAARGMAPDAYPQMQGKTREEIIEESKPDAAQELRREAVLAAIVEAEGIEATEEELLEALAGRANTNGRRREKLLDRLREKGRDAMIREEIRIRKAIDAVADDAKPIPIEQAEAREKIWTRRRSARPAGTRSSDPRRSRRAATRAPPVGPSIECRA